MESDSILAKGSISDGCRETSERPTSDGALTALQKPANASVMRALDQLLSAILCEARRRQNVEGRNEDRPKSDSSTETPTLCMLQPTCSDLEILLGYIDGDIVTAAHRSLSPSNNLSALSLPERQYVALLEAWKKQTQRFQAEMLESALEACRSHSMTMVHRLAVAQVFLVYAVASSKASDVVDLIMTQLDPEAQLELQEVIEQYHEGSSAELESADDSNVEQHEKERGANAKNIVPPLQLKHLAREDRGSVILSNPSPEHRSRVALEEPQPASVTDTETEDRHDTFLGEGRGSDHALLKAQSDECPEDVPQWKSKYTRLKEALHEAEAARDRLAARFELTLKELEEQQRTQEHWASKRRSETAVAQTSAAEVVETLEREIAMLKEELTRVMREKKDAEKELQTQLNLLRDENQLLMADVAKMTKLQASVEKYKSRVEELTVVKTRNQQLERQVEEYLDRMLNLEEEVKAATELKRALESYKTKVTELEAEQVLAAVRHDDAQKRVTALLQNVEEADKKRAVAELRLNAVEAEYQAKIAELECRVPDDLSVDIQDDRLRERVARLEKENDLLRHGEQRQTLDRVVELEQQLDDTQRLKDVLEKQYKALLANVALEKEQKGTQDSLEQATKLILAEKDNELLQQKAELQKALNENQRLSAELDHEKAKVQLIKETIETRLENQYESVVAQLKGKIQLLEREVCFMRLSRDEQLAVQRREERLMAAAFHEVGARCHQLQTERNRIKQEYEAVVLKLQQRKSVGKMSKEQNHSPRITSRPSAQDSYRV